MKMNATKLTIALVALLLALTCVFAACGKKNETPVDDNPTPVDDKPVAVDTVAKEDLNAIAESLKSAYAANYVDLYAPATATDIEAAKSAALINIFAASSKEEAQKVADDFIAYLRSQKTIIDSIAALVEKIGDVSLKDADALNELSDVVAKLDAAYAGTNAAKKAALDAYKADTATQKTIKAIVDRYAQLKSAKKDADVVKGGTKADGTISVDDGINAQIAALQADFTKEGKELKLADFNAYTALTKKIADFAKDHALVADTDAYADVFDLTTLNAAKKLLDDTFAKDEVLAKMLTVVDQSAALDAAAEKALWREYVYIPAEDVKTFDGATGFTEEVTFADGTKGYAKTGNVYKLSYDNTTVATIAYDTAFTFEDGGKFYRYNDGTKFFATEEDAAAANVENTVKIEIELVQAVYKLSLKDAVETAKEAREALNDYTTAALEKYGYGASGDAVKAAVDNIDAKVAAYTASVTRAAQNYNTTLAGAVLNGKTNVDIRVTTSPAYTGKDIKDATRGTYSLQAEFDLSGDKLGNNITNNQKYIANAIEEATKNFVAKSETGTFYNGSALYINDGDYKTANTSGSYKFNLVDGVPAITYKAWTYRYQLKEAGDVDDTVKLNAFKLLKTADNDAATAKAAVRWLKMYIGEGEYEDSYDFVAYTDYDQNLTKVFKKNVVLYMTDRAITEVAVPGVDQIRGNAVNVAKDETAVDAKLLSPYTVAKALIAEQDKIDAAKAEAIEEIKATALALSTAGGTNAAWNARDMKTIMLDGSYLNEKLYEDDSPEGYLAITAVNTVEVVVADKPEETKALVKDLIDKAAAAADDAETALKAIEAKHKTGDDTFVTLQDLLDIYKANGVVLSLTKTTINAINDSLKANAAYSELFASYIEEAKRLYDIAAAGEKAKIIGTEGSTPGEDDKGNLIKTQADKNLKKVQNVAYIFQDYGNFALGNTGTDKITTAAGFDFLDGYNTIPLDHDDVKNRIKAIFNAKVDAAEPYSDDDFSGDYTVGDSYTDSNNNGKWDDAPAVAYSTEDNKFLTAALKEATDKFTEAFAAYKGISAVVVTDALVPAVATANTTIGAFLDEAAEPDYINLKVVYTFGDEKVEYDLLTETYRALTMKKAYSVIDKILDEAKKYHETFTDTNDNGVCDGTETFTDSTSGDLANGTWDSAVALLTVTDGWKDAATKRINKIAVSFKEVTSLKAAEEALDGYAASETVYDLGGVVDVFAKFDSSVTLKTLKQAIK